MPAVAQRSSPPAPSWAPSRSSRPVLCRGIPPTTYLPLPLPHSAPESCPPLAVPCALHFARLPVALLSPVAWCASPHPPASSSIVTTTRPHMTAAPQTCRHARTPVLHHYTHSGLNRSGLLMERRVSDTTAALARRGGGAKAPAPVVVVAHACSTRRTKAAPTCSSACKEMRV